MRLAQALADPIFLENVMDRRQSLKWLFGLAVLPLTGAGTAWPKESPGSPLLELESELPELRT
jgi:hypothetical protein